MGLDVFTFSIVVPFSGTPGGKSHAREEGRTGSGRLSNKEGHIK